MLVQDAIECAQTGKSDDWPHVARLLLAEIRVLQHQIESARLNRSDLSWELEGLRREAFEARMSDKERR